MSDDKPVKSAYELAMERLRKSDKDAGVVWEPLTDAQKAQVSEIDSTYKARIGTRNCNVIALKASLYVE